MKWVFNNEVFSAQFWNTKIKTYFLWRIDIQHNDTQHDGIQHNDIPHNDILNNDIQLNNIQHNDISIMTSA
jgi:hypothetical protein